MGVLFWSAIVLAQEVYVIQPKQSTIEGSIRYTVIGKYRARFTDFGGTITYDRGQWDRSSVTLRIKTKSLRSQYPTLDGIVLSKRLLDAGRFPEIFFQSHSVKRRAERYWVEGTLDFHGEKKTLAFPFRLEEPRADQHGALTLRAQGRWIIRRKDFEVIWSKILDHGGIIVGDHIVVDWEIFARENNEPPTGQDPP